MFDFLILYRVMPVILLGMNLFVCVITGGLVVSEAAGSGREAVLVWSLLAAVIMAAFGALFGGIIWCICEFGKPKTGAIIMGIVAAICTFSLPLRFIITS